MFRISLIMIATMAIVGSALAEGYRSSSATGAVAYIISPKDGETVQNPVKVVFGLSGMGVCPAGLQKNNTGHHHLLIDTGLPSFGDPIAKDENHRHFGGGQTEAVIEFEPGTHTLQLLLGDHNHIPHFPPIMSERITIKVF